jgi:hypothetical protein
MLSLCFTPTIFINSVQKLDVNDLSRSEISYRGILWLATTSFTNIRANYSAI